MTGDIFAGMFFILVGCAFVVMGILGSYVARQVVPVGMTARRWSRTEASLWLSSMDLAGLGCLCLAVTAFRFRYQDLGSVLGQLNSILALIFLCVGFGLYMVWMAMSRIHDKQFREGR
jgi:hypothetical protein